MVWLFLDKWDKLAFSCSIAWCNLDLLYISTSLSVKVCSGVESAHVLLSEEPSPLTIYDIVLFAKSSTEILFGRTPSSTTKVEHDESAPTSWIGNCKGLI